MSPEQASGREMDARSDIFSFGIVLYEMLAGSRPFLGSTNLEVLQTIIHGAPRPLDDRVPVALRTVVEKALEKDPADRYQSMQEMVVDLRRLVGQSAERPVATAGKPHRRNGIWITGAAAVVLLIAGITWKWLPRADAAPIRSIAVLPLANLSGDPNQEYFSDGNTEALISSLAQIHALDVISRTSVMRYKGTTKTAREIGRETGADAIVEGSLQRAGNRVRVAVQLIRTATDKHIWANTYDRDLSDALKLESEVAQSIARQIQVEITPEESGRLKNVRSVVPEARD
jgi:TolB-like protein